MGVSVGFADGVRVGKGVGLSVGTAVVWVGGSVGEKVGTSDDDGLRSSISRTRALQPSAQCSGDNAFHVSPFQLWKQPKPCTRCLPSAAAQTDALKRLSVHPCVTPQVL